MKEREAGAPRSGPHDEAAVLDARLHAHVLSGLDVDCRRRGLHERHARLAADVERVKRRQIPMLQAGRGVGGEAPRERPPREQGCHDDAAEHDRGEGRAFHDVGVGCFNAAKRIRLDTLSPLSYTVF